MRAARHICWDLDETLGFFRPGRISEPMKGIRPLLEKLRGEGIGNVITTAAPMQYAEHALKRTGMGGHFDAVFDCSVVFNGSLNKTYGPVAEKLGVSAADAMDRLLVIGNEERDIPADLPLVTVMYPDAIKYDASVLDIVLRGLSAGRSWWWGYETMLSGRINTRENDYFEGGDLELGDVKLALGRVKPNPFAQEAEHMVLVLGASEKRAAVIATVDEPIEVRLAEMGLLTAA